MERTVTVIVLLTIIVIVLLTIWTAKALDGEVCDTYDGWRYSGEEYCTYGCCGEGLNKECCAPYVWVIIIAVIGALMFLSCIVGCICCLVKQQGHRGQVVNQTPIVATVAQTNTIQGPPPYNYGFQQPSTAFVPNQAQYQQPYQQPSSFPNQPMVPFPHSKQDAAYPPPQ